MIHHPLSLVYPILDVVACFFALFKLDPFLRGCWILEGTDLIVEDGSSWNGFPRKFTWCYKDWLPGNMWKHFLTKYNCLNPDWSQMWAFCDEVIIVPNPIAPGFRTRLFWKMCVFFFYCLPIFTIALSSLLHGIYYPFLGRFLTLCYCCGPCQIVLVVDVVLLICLDMTSQNAISERF
jgi:hypothetical protein